MFFTGFNNYFSCIMFMEICSQQTLFVLYIIYNMYVPLYNIILLFIFNIVCLFF